MQHAKHRSSIPELHTVYCVVLPSLVFVTLLFFALVLVTGCASVFSDLQSAKLVSKGRFEATPSFSSVYFSEDGDRDHVQNHLGLQAAYGMGNNIDLRVRSERIATDADGGDPFAAYVLGFGPKTGIVKDKVALYLPVGFAFGGDIEDVSETWEFHPTLLFTRSTGNHFELNPSAKALIPLTNEDADVQVALNLGIGISADLQKWVVRPELGFLLNPGEDGHYTHFSIACTVYP